MPVRLGHHSMMIIAAQTAASFSSSTIPTTTRLHALIFRAPKKQATPCIVRVNTDLVLAAVSIWFCLNAASHATLFSPVLTLIRLDGPQQRSPVTVLSHLRTMRFGQSDDLARASGGQ